MAVCPQQPWAKAEWPAKDGGCEPDLWKGHVKSPFLFSVVRTALRTPPCYPGFRMKAGHGLLGAAVTLFLVVVSVRATGVGAQNAPGAAAAQSAPGAPAAQTALSAQTHYPACSTRHHVRRYIDRITAAAAIGEVYQQWRQSLHIRMTKPIAEATVVGDFSGVATLSDHGRSFEFGTADGKPFMRIAFGAANPETFHIDYTLGAKRYQGYLSMMADGRIYVLPAFWHVESRRWVDWKRSRRFPRRARSAADLEHQLFQLPRHQHRAGLDVATKRYKSTWTEMGIGCEACHGPGKPHVDLMEAWEKNPASKPAYDNSAKNRELSGLLKIFAGTPPRARPTTPAPTATATSRTSSSVPRRRSLRRLRAAVLNLPPHPPTPSGRRASGRGTWRRRRAGA